MRIFQILTHSSSWVTKNIEEDIYDGWQVRTAKAIRKIAPELQFECILPEKNLTQTMVEEKDGIIYRVFPSTALGYGREISLPLIRALKAKENEKIILHIHGAHNYFTYALCSIFRHLPIIVQHHGDCPPFDLFARRRRLILCAPILGVEQLIMSRTLGYADYFFVLTEKAKARMSQIVNPAKIRIQGMGVDFDVFQPIPKPVARRELNFYLLNQATKAEGKKYEAWTKDLTADSQIILYVGKLIKYKGCEVVIDVYKELRKQSKVILILVGGDKTDELYSYAQKSNAIVISRQPNARMPIFYASASVTVLPGTKSLNDWGGIGIALVESLACGTPVVAGTLKNFPGRTEEIGILAETKEEVAKGVMTVFKNPLRFKNCRKHAQKFYDWQKIAQNTISVYEALARKYYRLDGG